MWNMEFVAFKYFRLYYLCLAILKIIVHPADTEITKEDFEEQLLLPNFTPCCL